MLDQYEILPMGKFAVVDMETGDWIVTNVSKEVAEKIYAELTSVKAQ